MMRTSMMKKGISGLHRWIAALLCAGMFAAAAMIPLPAAASEEATGKARVECGGFDTPEEAVTAFCDALRENDIQKAVSTFAIESYCENFDYAGHLRRVGSLWPVTTVKSEVIAPAQNDLLSDLNVGLRAGDVAKGIYNPLVMIAVDHMALSEDEKIREVAEGLREMKYVPTTEFSTFSELSYLIEQMQQFPDFSGMEISKPISPVAFGLISSNYLSERNLDNIMNVAMVNGASGVTELGVIMEDDTDIYYLTMNIVKYGDKWYNCTLGGNIMQLMGVEAARQGIMGAPKDVAGEGIKNLLVFEDETGRAVIAKELLPGFEDFRKTFEERHQEYNENVVKKAQENGLTYDPDRPWLEQLDILKELADKCGENFYSADYISIYAMPYEDMLAFFSEEELAGY